MGGKMGGSERQSARLIGQIAEDVAFNYLITNGLRPVMRNYACRVGEVDLIMRDGSGLVFVEVRCRKSVAFGAAVETVVGSKQRKLIRAAQCYMLEHRLSDSTNCRFDVVGVVLPDKHQPADITWIQDAFQVEYH